MSPHIPHSTRSFWHTRSAVGVLLLCLLSGCSTLFKGTPLDQPVSLIAVMPIVRDAPQDTHHDTPEMGSLQLLPGAEQIITAHIYGVLASAPHWRFVPDLTVKDALYTLPTDGTLTARAQALGQAVTADAVLFGTVSRFQERLGSDVGADQPATVHFTLHLLSVTSGEILWEQSFAQTQEALSSNIFNWWQFWQGGPRWFTVQEFSRLAVARVLDDLATRLE